MAVGDLNGDGKSELVWSTDVDFLQAVTGPSKPGLSAALQLNPITGQAPLKVNYVASASGGVGPYSYNISFGDGSRSTAASGNHTYSTSGEYTVTAIVRDRGADMVTRSAKIHVTERPALTASLSVDPSTGKAPLTIAYAVTPYGGWGPYTFDVSFGDGGSSTADRGTHTYAAPGLYDLKATVKDANGTAVDRITRVTVTALADLLASLVISPDRGVAPLTVSIVTEVSGGLHPYNVSVTLGDGTTAWSTHVNHTYATPGVFTVSSRVQDLSGAVAFANSSVQVDAPPGNPSESVAGMAIAAAAAVGTVGGSALALWIIRRARRRRTA